MIDNKVWGRIIGIEKLPASVDEDFHDSTILSLTIAQEITMGKPI